MGYTIKQKIEICLKSEADPHMTQADLARWAQLQYLSEKAPSQTTISRILSSKNDLIASKEADFKLIRRRRQSNPLLRRILTEWITQATWENIPITTPIIQLTANAIWNRLPLHEKDGKGLFTPKWCNHFIKKLNVNLTGSSQDALANPGGYKLNKIWKLDEKVELKAYLRELALQENYSPQDIFTIDEFQLFYSLPLDQIFDVSSIDKGLKQSSSSTENSLTIMLGSNMDGSEKLTPLIVGKYDRFDVSSSTHSAFKNQTSSLTQQNLMNKVTEAYQLFYNSNSNKWITSSMFQKYLLTLEHKLESTVPNRKILILLDDSSSHRIINLKFKNIRLCYLKNNTSNKSPFASLYSSAMFDYLPMNFGVIEEFKILYRLQQYLQMIKLQRISLTKELQAFGASDGMNLNNIKVDSVGAFNSSSATNVLTESDYQIPLITVLEWIKRSWESITPERIFLSWKRTKLFDMGQAWPTTDSTLAARVSISLLPLMNSSEKFNIYKSYNKLHDIMKFLNVVVPWEIDELLGLVNERGKPTLSYVSIEEIIGSCLLESYDEAVQTKKDQSNDAKAADLLATDMWYDTQANDPNNLNTLLDEPIASSSASHSSTTSPSPPSNEQIKIRSQQAEVQSANRFSAMQMNFTDFNPPSANVQDTMNINSLIAAANPISDVQTLSSTTPLGITGDPGSHTYTTRSKDVGAEGVIGMRQERGGLPGLTGKYASTNSVSLDREFNTLAQPRNKHRIDSGIFLGEKRKQLLSPGSNPGSGFPFISTSPLNDSLPSTTSPSPYSQPGLAANNGSLLPKSVFSGVSYRSSSATNLEDYRMSPPIVRPSPVVARTNIGDSGNSGDLASLLGKVIDSANTNGLKLSSNAVNELKLNLKSLQLHCEAEESRQYPSSR